MIRIIGLYCNSKYCTELVFFSAFETFGAPGKMAVEMSMIGFMVGTCIAFFVVIGDLAPPIIAYLMNVVPSENLRIVTLLGKPLRATLYIPIHIINFDVLKTEL